MDKVSKCITNQVTKNVNQFDYFIGQAIESLTHSLYQDAENNIMKAVSFNFSAPQAHNLFGALAELKGDSSLAGKHYLAANALDPTYLPAIRNLRRLTTYTFKKKPVHPDLGLNNNSSDNNDLE